MKSFVYLCQIGLISIPFLTRVAVFQGRDSNTMDQLEQRGALQQQRACLVPRQRARPWQEGVSDHRVPQGLQRPWCPTYQ